MDSDKLIFGYTWAEIDKAQRGGGLTRAILHFEDPKSATATDESLLAEHGKDGLMSMGFFGVLDRLKTTGLI